MVGSRFGRPSLGEGIIAVLLRAGGNPFNLAFPAQLRRFVSRLLAKYLPGAGLRKFKFVYIFKECIEGQKLMTRTNVRTAEGP